MVTSAQAQVRLGAPQAIAENDNDVVPANATRDLNHSRSSPPVRLGQPREITETDRDMASSPDLSEAMRQWANDIGDRGAGAVATLVAAEELPPNSEIILGNALPNHSGQYEEIAAAQSPNNSFESSSADWEAAQAPLFSQSTQQIELDQLIFLALNNSNRIQVARYESFIEQEQVIQADATFDWQSFAQTLFQGTNQANGSELDAGQNVERLQQDAFNNDLGLRRKNRLGGDFEIKQSINTLASNSEFLSPNNQGITQLVMRYNQPLLRDGGRLVNEGIVLSARFAADAAISDATSTITGFIEEVVQNYWDLQRLRRRLISQRRFVGQLEELLKSVRKRSRIDARESLLGQIQSDLETQRANLAANFLQIKQAQLRLIRAAGDRGLQQFEELIPTSPLPSKAIPVDSATALGLAMQNRPEIRSAVIRISGAELSQNISRRQLLPSIALILESSANGVNPEFDVGKSLGDQLSEGAPSISAGLSFDFPIGNRRARSEFRSAQLQLSRDISQLEDTSDQVRLEVLDALAQISGNTNQFAIRDASVSKAQDVVASLLKRRRIMPTEFDQVSQLYTREILDAHQRRVQAEFALIDLEANYAIAIVQLRKATGLLLTLQNQPIAPVTTPIHVAPVVTSAPGLPTLPFPSNK
ncbi:MAG: TolC family protein [Planctomycetota bacterium]